MAVWHATLNLKDLFDQFKDNYPTDAQAVEVGKKIAQRLQGVNHSTFDEWDTNERDRIVDAFENEIFDLQDFDGWMNDLYDWADGVRVWVKTSF